eukprot:768082-Hanusia_phi.AAC.8
MPVTTNTRPDMGCAAQVRERTFPDLNYSPYKMASGELEAFRKMLPELDLKWGGIQNKVGSTESEETKVY